MLRLSLLFASFALLVAPLHAQTRAEWEPTLSKNTYGKHPVVPPVKLRYDLSWKGALKSGRLTFELNKPDKRYPHYHVAHVYGGSTGAAAKLFPYKANFVSFLRRKNLRPVSFVGEETDKKEHMKTTNRYNHKRMTVEEFVRPKGKRKPHTNRKEFVFPNTFDALSAMYFIRSQKLRNGDVLRFVLHPFSSGYLATVTVKGREKHNGRDCIKLDLKLRKIREDFSLRAYKKMSKATLWISDDQLRIPVELRSAVFIGDVRMTLKSMERL